MYRDYNLSGFSSVAGKLKVSHDACQNTLYVYVRRKIVKFDFEFYIDNSPSKAREVPAFDVAHLKFFDLSPLDLHNYKFSKENPTVLYDIYRRYEPDYMKVWDYGPEHKTVEIPCREKSAVYYFSGESFKFYPYFMENSGYSLYYYAQEPIHKSNRVGDTIYITNLRAADKNIIGVGKSFKLDFIGADNYVQDANKMANYFRVSETTNNKEYEVWNSEFLSNPDNGAGLLTQCGSGSMHNHTIMLSFVFSEEYNLNSFVKNVRIVDKKSTNRNVRADSCQLDRYTLVVDDDGLSYYNVIPTINHTLNIKLFNMNPSYKKGVRKMCNMQLFDIIIDNTANGGVRSAYDSTKTLSNIDKTKEKVFTISTVPPAISTQSYCFSNIDTKNATDIDPEVYIHAFTVVDMITHGQALTTANNKLGASSEKGHIIYYIKNARRVPNKKTIYLPPNSTKYYSDYTIMPFSLHNQQRILHSYHWVSDGVSFLNPFANMLNESGAAYKIYDKIRPVMGKANPPATDSIVNSIASVSKEYICENVGLGNDEVLGSNNFWLSKDSELTNKLNNKYNCETKEEQNWDYWGAGKLYAEDMVRTAANVRFDVKLINNIPIIINGKPKFYTKIRINIGDN